MTKFSINFHYNWITKIWKEKFMENQNLREELKSIIEDADFSENELKILVEKAKEIMNT